MARRILLAWIVASALYVLGSCAHGSDFIGVGGAGGGGSTTGSLSTSSGMGGVTGGPTTTSTAATTGPATTSTTTSGPTTTSTTTSSTAATTSSTAATTSSTATTSGAGGADAGTGFGPCVTQAEVDAQSSQLFEVGFCFNPLACFLCPDDAVNPGDIVCSPACVCAPLPPICSSDAGTD